MSSADVELDVKTADAATPKYECTTGPDRPEVKEGKCNECCACYPLQQMEKSGMCEKWTQEQIDEAIDCNLLCMNEDEQRVIKRYAELRSEFKSPHDEIFEQDLEDDEDFKAIFGLSLMTTKVWTDKHGWDMWYFHLQKHPLLGFFSHHAHPLELTDRTLILITGWCICLLNQTLPICRSDICTNTCYPQFLNNGVCEDGGEDGHYRGTEVLTNLGHGAFPCDWGTDCWDCGARDELDYSMYHTFTNWTRGLNYTWTTGELGGFFPGEEIEAKGKGFWCFPPLLDVNIWFIGITLPYSMPWMTFLIIPLCLAGVTNLILCKCCIKEHNKKRKQFYLDFGQSAGNLLVMILVVGAGFQVASLLDRGINWIALVANKVFIYALVAGINTLAFIAGYKSEKQKIIQLGGVANWIKATQSF